MHAEAVAEQMKPLAIISVFRKKKKKKKQQQQQPATARAALVVVTHDVCAHWAFSLLNIYGQFVIGSDYVWAYKTENDIVYIRKWHARSPVFGWIDLIPPATAVTHPASANSNNDKTNCCCARLHECDTTVTKMC